MLELTVMLSLLKVEILAQTLHSLLLEGQLGPCPHL